MPEHDLYALMGDKENTGEIHENWFVAIPGIVAINEDPEHQDRIKCVIPYIDEDVIHDKWIDSLVRFVGPEGYGDSHRPALGTEVILFGRSGQPHNIFYVSRFNEDFLVPERLRVPGVRGFKHDDDYLALVDGDYTLEAGAKVTIEAEGEVKLKGSKIVLQSDTKVEILAPQGLWVNGVQILVP
jgi:hypothetical protein